MHILKQKGPLERAADQLRRTSGHRIVKSGISAGVALVALTVASAVTNVARRREQQG